MTNLILCGLPGAGKTTVATLLAETLKMQSIDTDQLIEQKCGVSCREYYLTHGEKAFREIESNVIFQLKNQTNSVIALGGGAVESTTLLDFIPRLGSVIFLDAPMEVLLERKIENDKPAYAQCERDYRTMMRKRLPLYQELATIHIDTSNKIPNQIIQELSEMLARV